MDSGTFHVAEYSGRIKKLKLAFSTIKNDLEYEIHLVVFTIASKTIVTSHRLTLENNAYQLKLYS